MDRISVRDRRISHRGFTTAIIRKTSEKPTLSYIASPPLSARAGGGGRDRGGDHAHYDPDFVGTAKAPWNKGRLIGQKRPLKPKEVSAIRVRLQLEGRKRDLALFTVMGLPDSRA